MFSILKGLNQNKSLARLLMNTEIAKHSLSGDVLDIGGGKKPSYVKLFNTGQLNTFNIIDFETIPDYNLEKDRLPYHDASLDQILLFNILEHIYNYRFVVNEAYRVLKKNGVVLGFVPFLVNYHPDPHDYFRYTAEALDKIFSEAGFKDIDIKEIGGGPFYVNFNTILFSMPKISRIVIFPFYYFLDKIYLKLRPKASKRFALGYFFILKK